MRRPYVISMDLTEAALQKRLESQGEKCIEWSKSVSFRVEAPTRAAASRRYSAGEDGGRQYPSEDLGREEELRAASEVALPGTGELFEGIMGMWKPERAEVLVTRP